MTLVVGIRCSDGIVMASDSASTDLEAGTKMHFEKVWPVGELAMLCGASGNIGLIQKVKNSLHRLSLKSTARRTIPEIKKLVGPELHESKKYWVQYPTQAHQFPPACILLIGMVIDGSYWLLEIEKDCTDTLYHDDMGNFAAIGSGKSFAQAIFRPHIHTARNIDIGKVMAYRVVADSINLASHFLSFPIQMHTLTLDEGVKELSVDEIKSLSDICSAWSSIEKESLGKVLAGDLAKREAPEIPTLEG